MSSDPFERIVFRSNLVRIGAFRCAPDHPCFHDSGPAQNYCFVFPRTAVEIQHEHEAAFVANPNVGTFYNAGQLYRRQAISPEGDRCDWFGVDPAVLRDAVRQFDPAVDDHPEYPFRFTRGWTGAGTYLLQRSLFNRLEDITRTEQLGVEETVFELLDQVLRSAYEVPSEIPAGITPRQRDAVHDMEMILSRPSGENVCLQQIASEVGMSPYHVCRLFSRVTGIRLRRYRLRLLLRVALLNVLDSSRSLTAIALDAGFSSHSHFTNSFRHEFGTTPSALRSAHPARVATSNFLIASKP